MAYQIDNYNFKGKRTLIRVDFNVPLDDQFNITDDTRIRAALKTIRKVMADGGKVVLMSHLGRPKGGPEDKYSLRHIVKHTAQLLGTEVSFATDCIGQSASDVVNALTEGGVAILENLRFHKEEEGGDEFLPANLQKTVMFTSTTHSEQHTAHMRAQQ